MGYLRQSLKGFGWMAGFRGVTRALAFVRVAIVARLLTPAHFGLFGIASLVLSFLETLTTTGINIFLIQERKSLNDYIDSAWFISIFRGILMSVVIFLMAPFIASFFDAPNSLSLLRLIATVPFIRGFINPSRVKYQKDLEFNKEFWFSLAVFLVDSMVVILIAFWARSPVALVWGLIAGAVLEVGLSFALLKPRPGMGWEFGKVKEILSRGKWITAGRISKYLFQEGDDIVVGKVLNTSSLGYYQMAYKLSTLPITEVLKVVNKVTFPIYSKFSDDKKRLRRAFLRTVLGISLLVIPIGLVLFLFSQEIVLIVLGDNWLAAAPALRILSAFGVIQAISGSTSAVFLSVRKQEYDTYVSAVMILSLGILIFPLIMASGITGAATAALISSIVALPVNIFFLLKVLKVDLF